MATTTKIGLVSLGCPKNLVDSEEMLGALVETGQAEMVGDVGAADVLVVNTCGFIESAKQESIDAILDAVRRKGQGQVRKVVVTGCLAQRYGAELAAEIPEVDAFLGIQSSGQVADVVFGTPHAGGDRRRGRLALPTVDERNRVAPIGDKYPLVPPARVRATARWTAYLKVSEGCDHACTFCSIPGFRGRHRSKPLERVLDEARRLVDGGARELNLIAQDTTAYGMDLYDEPRPAAPAGRAGAHPGSVLRAAAVLLPDHDHRPARPHHGRHAQRGALRGRAAPARRRCRAQAHEAGRLPSSYRRRLFERLRAAMPDIALRTTFLVGFPGEDEAAFANLLAFVREVRFDRLGVFEYSPEEGTPGFAMGPRVPKRVAARAARPDGRAAPPCRWRGARRWSGASSTS